MNRKRDCFVSGSKVVLIPYCPEHVKRYHGWMQSAELRTQTASEPLSLEEEYEMQKKWMRDDDNYQFIEVNIEGTTGYHCKDIYLNAEFCQSTFIILDKKLYENASVNEIDGMVGDVNLFFNEPNDTCLAEIEVMIAEPSARRKGFAYETLVMMMCYAAGELGITKFRAKILDTNTASLQLFSKLDFVEVGRNAVFNEVVLECPVAAMSIKEKLMDIGLKGGQLEWRTYVPKHDFEST